MDMVKNAMGGLAPKSGGMKASLSLLDSSSPVSGGKRRKSRKGKKARKSRKSKRKGRKAKRSRRK
tara:strand:+ start:346 stop:540 length:195 start_codon:yes stop_codon:yes gene_type:complete